MLDPCNLQYIEFVENSSGTLTISEDVKEFDTPLYQLDIPKDMRKFINDIKATIRSSYEYRVLIKYLKTYCDMNICAVSGVESTEENKIGIEVHHWPFTLEDIIVVVYLKRVFYKENINVPEIAKEVMALHYMCTVGLIPLSKTVHELAHNGYIFIPVTKVFGNYKTFVEYYDEFIDDTMKECLDNIEHYSEVYNPEQARRLLEFNTLYVDGSNMYQIPQMNYVKDTMVMRIQEIKNNGYQLPIMGQQDPPKAISFDGDHHTAPICPIEVINNSTEPIFPLEFTA